MKNLKSYKLFESNTVSLEEWEDFKDLIQSEILDEWNISQDLVKESLPGKSGNLLLEPELHIRINEHFNNSEPVDFIRVIRNLHKQVYQMTDKFISVNWSSQQVNIMLNDYPNHWSIIQDFNLKEVKSDNIVDNKTGGVCDLETALSIIDYLNTFTRLCYDSDKELFIKCFREICKKGDYKIVFSLPLFTLERYRQKVCFKFCLEDEWNENSPVFIIDNNHTESPFIEIRYSAYNWNRVTVDSKMLDFLKNYII
jgi:hypothetical protein